MTRLLAGALVLIGATATSAHARPYKDFCDQFEPLRKLADLKYVKPVLRVKPKEDTVKAADVVFTIEAKAGAIKVVPAADGAIVFPMSDKLCDENPNIEVNQPTGSVGISVSIDPNIPPVRTLDYRLLESLRHEWDTAISRQNLVYRMLAPSAKAYQIVFEPGTNGSVEIRLPQVTRRFAADDKGVVRIPFDDAWIAANPAIVLSDVPRKIGLAFKS
jgi:hypothetical protein